MIGKSIIRVKRVTDSLLLPLGLKLQRGPPGAPNILSYFEMIRQRTEASEKIFSLEYDFRDVMPYSWQSQERSDSTFGSPEHLPLKWS